MCVCVLHNWGDVASAHETRLYVLSRVEAARKMESTQFFHCLANAVEEQRETVDRVDRFLESTEISVEAARSELSKYLASVPDNRSLVMKFFGILAFFLVTLTLSF